jgi:replicative DNA helicase Mcm
MKPEDQIERFHSFLEDKHRRELMDTIRKGNRHYEFEFSGLLEFDSELADELLEHPEDVLKAGEMAVSKFNLPEPINTFHLRVTGLPESQKIAIRDIRSVNLGKFILLDGLVRQKSDVRPRVTSARFECPSCGNVLTILQLDSKFKEPSACSCGRRGKFRLLDKELVDAQGLVIEETPESLTGGEQPKRLNVFLKEDLVSPMSDRHTNPGSKIQISGWVKEIPKILPTGGKSTRFDLVLEGNYVKSMEDSFYDLLISEKEEKEILEFSKNPNVLEIFIDSLAPSIYGYDQVKLALLFQLVGGVRKQRGDGVVTRGDIHVLLVGDPGAGKSQLLKRIAIVAPKARYVSGKGVSGAGLTATVVKDEFLGGWSLEAGALVLANKGLCCIDELDKMTTEDRSAMHEALEQQTISISKANVQATLVAKTTVLAAANPKFGRFDPYEMLAKQIDLPPALINRFDLIFPIQDIPNETKDEKLATHILGLHQKPEAETPLIENEFFRKYIAYARQRINPRLNDEALKEIKSYYIKMRKRGLKEEGTVRSIPISPRQLEALVRLAEACARLRLVKEVKKEDARVGIKLLQYCLSKVGMDPETGEIDIDRISTGVSASKRGRIMNIKEIIAQLEEKIGKAIPIGDIVAACEQKHIKKEEVEEIVEQLKRSGDIFEPKPGFVSKL